MKPPSSSRPKEIKVAACSVRAGTSSAVSGTHDSLLRHVGSLVRLATQQRARRFPPGHGERTRTAHRRASARTFQKTILSSPHQSTFSRVIALFCRNRSAGTVYLLADASPGGAKAWDEVIVGGRATPSWWWTCRIRWGRGEPVTRPGWTVKERSDFRRDGDACTEAKATKGRTNPAEVCSPSIVCAETLSGRVG